MSLPAASLPFHQGNARTWRPEPCVDKVAIHGPLPAPRLVALAPAVDPEADRVPCSRCPLAALHWDAQMRPYCEDCWDQQPMHEHRISQTVPLGLLRQVVARSLPQTGWRLSPREAQLLGVLLLFYPATLSADELVVAGWGAEMLDRRRTPSHTSGCHCTVSMHHINVVICRLRKRLPPRLQIVHTARVGYRVEVHP